MRDVFNDWTEQAPAVLEVDCFDIAMESFEAWVESNPGVNPVDGREHMLEAAYKEADKVTPEQAVYLCACGPVKDGEAFLHTVGIPENPTFADMCMIIARGELRHRIAYRIDEWIDDAKWMMEHKTTQ